MKSKVLLFILFVVLFSVEISAQQKKDIDRSCSEKLIETLTVLTGTSLYQIYLNINMMNENFETMESYEIYDNNLFILEKQLTNIIDLLNTFNKSKYLTKEDYEYIFKLKEISFLLQEDIRLFRGFIENGDDDSFKEFFVNHTKVNKQLKEIVEIELGPRNK